MCTRHLCWTRTLKVTDVGSAAGQLIQQRNQPTIKTRLFFFPKIQVSSHIKPQGEPKLCYQTLLLERPLHSVQQKTLLQRSQLYDFSQNTIYWAKRTKEKLDIYLQKTSESHRFFSFLLFPPSLTADHVSKQATYLDYYPVL